MKLEALQALIDVTREDWDPTEDYPGRRDGERPLSRIEGYEVHHSGSPGPEDLSFLAKQRWLLSVERWHEETKRWYDGFYNLVIWADGSLWGFRNPTIPSQTNKPDLRPVLTVLLPGNLNNTEATPQQKNTMLRLMGLLDLPTAGNIRGHRQREHYGATACPGDSGIGLVTWVQNSIHGSTSSLGGQDMLYSTVPTDGNPYHLPVSWLDGWGKVSAVGAVTAIEWVKDGFPHQRLTVGQARGLRDRATKWGTLDESTASQDWIDLAALNRWTPIDATQAGAIDIVELASQVAGQIVGQLPADTDPDAAEIATAVFAELAHRFTV